MSYRIEKQKRVLAFNAPASDERFQPFSHVQLWMHSADDNNVSPRTFDWHLLAISFNTIEKYDGRKWGAEWLLPQRLWELAHCADGGGIKPNNRDVTGINYLKQWKQAAEHALLLDLEVADLRLTPRLSLWLPEGQTLPLPLERFQALEKSNAELRHTVLHRLPWQSGYYPQQRTAEVGNAGQFLDAVWLANEALRERLPCRFYLGARAGTTFLEAGAPQPELLTA